MQENADCSENIKIGVNGMENYVDVLKVTQLFHGRKVLGQYRTNELVRRRMNFSSDAMADFEGLLEVNRKICKQQMAEKASPTLPTNCAVLPLYLHLIPELFKHRDFVPDIPIVAAA